ncbi:unannotated protein [freshwater metagenome]|uniref:Unannotated protein n=1 Tax=freshwater metagenome TaxID=449393 RepID=A0A6J7DP91_9ZZZZ
MKAVDRDGREVVLEAAAGERVYCPAGFSYTLEPHGEAYSASWTSAPSPAVGVWDAPEYSKQLEALREG